MTDKTDIAALRPSERSKLGFVTDDNTGGHYVAECEECGQIFPSQTCDGGEQIADSGDYGDCFCPHCGFIDPLECDNANLVWNVQQLKIVNLTKQLEAERQRAENWSVSFENERLRADKLAAHIEALKGEQVPVAWRFKNESGEYRVSIEKKPNTYGRTDFEPLFTAPQKPVSPPVGEIVAWSGTNSSVGITREVDFRFLRFDVKPGTKLYAIEPAPATIHLCDPSAGVVMRPQFEKPEDCECSSIDYCESCLETMMSKPAPAAKSDLLTHAEALAVEARALASRIQAGE